MNEISLHKLLASKPHKNLISFYNAGEDLNYSWIAMELAEGGDLFDKIEADIGVGVDIAHVYFTQLISAVSYMHTMGVAHRDLKPENVLLSSSGNLKLADFGLASYFRHKGQTKRATSVVGSPPYMAPELLEIGTTRTGYDPDIADIWSCGIVLFVLLVGNTPWDEPRLQSWEFNEYSKAGKADLTDELWSRVPADALSLLHAMLKINPDGRFRLHEVRTHPWFTRPNIHLTPSGSIVDPIKLATQMMENLRVDFEKPTQVFSQDSDAMDLDKNTPLADKMDCIQLSATQPEAPLAESPFNWERPNILNSQPISGFQDDQFYNRSTQLHNERRIFLDNDVSLSQFSRRPTVPISLTQMASKFNEIVPSFSINHFVSDYPLDLLVERVSEALLQSGVPNKYIKRDDSASIQVVAISRRQQPMKGNVLIERHGREHFDVRFVKAKGDPVEWRRLFKNVAVHCKDLVIGRDHD
jgi:serine/threonine-protein kinase CHEK1